MKTLYEAASLVEAHLLKDLLAQEGVPAVIHGEFRRAAWANCRLRAWSG
jgi:hypothetical protein